MDELEKSLIACRDVLRRYGEHHWANEIDALLSTRLAPYDFAQRALSWFGGMGSLNDVYLHPTNGHPVSLSDVEPLNAQLKALVSSVFDAANTVRRASAFDR